MNPLHTNTKNSLRFIKKGFKQIWIQSAAIQRKKEHEGEMRNILMSLTEKIPMKRNYIRKLLVINYNAASLFLMFRQHGFNPSWLKATENIYAEINEIKYILSSIYQQYFIKSDKPDEGKANYLFSEFSFLFITSPSNKNSRIFCFPLLLPIRA